MESTDTLANPAYKFQIAQDYYNTIFIVFNAASFLFLILLMISWILACVLKANFHIFPHSTNIFNVFLVNSFLFFSSSAILSGIFGIGLKLFGLVFLKNSPPLLIGKWPIIINIILYFFFKNLVDGYKVIKKIPYLELSLILSLMIQFLFYTNGYEVCIFDIGNMDFLYFKYHRIISFCTPIYLYFIARWIPSIIIMLRNTDVIDLNNFI